MAESNTFKKYIDELPLRFISYTLEASIVIVFKNSDNDEQYTVKVTEEEAEILEEVAPRDLSIETSEAVWSLIAEGGTSYSEAFERGAFTLEGDTPLISILDEVFKGTPSIIYNPSYPPGPLPLPVWVWLMLSITPMIIYWISLDLVAGIYWFSGAPLVISLLLITYKTFTDTSTEVEAGSVVFFSMISLAIFFKKIDLLIWGPIILNFYAALLWFLGVATRKTNPAWEYFKWRLKEPVWSEVFFLNQSTQVCITWGIMFLIGGSLSVIRLVYNMDQLWVAQYVVLAFAALMTLRGLRNIEKMTETKLSEDQMRTIARLGVIIVVIVIALIGWRLASSI